MNTRMGMNATIGMLALALAMTWAGAWAAPVVSNVRAAQRDDGSGVVDIHYDLANGVGAIVVELRVSTDGGQSWTITPDAAQLSGAIGPGVTNGANRQIVWNARADRPDVCWPDARFRVIAHDEAPEPEGEPEGEGEGEGEPPGDEMTITLPGGVPLVMVRIPAGTYLRGRYPGEQDSYSSEDPQHQVTLTQDFYMGKYPVTQAQWLAVRGSWPSTAPSSSYGVGDNYPAYYVSWDDAQNFITSLNAHITSTGQGPATVRLPTEAEWEYACRAGTTTRFYWGDDPSYTQIGNYAWYTGNNSPNGTKPVGGKLPNPWGLYDMSGNVWEWCQDWYGTYPSGPVTDPTGPTSGSDRVIRGGRWNYYARDCRSARRNYNSPGSRFNIIGFRLAR